ncbi:HlyD family secretion protein [Balneola sp. MJW-20]|uniref:HlyD family secretion protein n=1 Tax=Gracilimonas aurantiaca TaxID=3234185 RepID=UPI003467DD54
MLNISPNSIKDQVDQARYSAMNRVELRRSGKVVMRLFSGLGLVTLLIMFLPWTQNIRTGGNITTVRPDQRPQMVNSVIAGRIERWYVREGDFVQQGDTILYISEIKDEYFDPELLSRTGQQLEAKEGSMESYGSKVEALNDQIQALEQGLILKLQQAENKLIQAQLKVVSDSTDLEAAKIDFQIADEQFKRMQELYDEGLKSLTDFERRKLARQKSQAELISKENKLLSSRNELINSRVEINSIEADYKDKIAKARSEKFTAQSNLFNADAEVTKLRNSYTNYSVRQGFYYITAPQTGYVTKAIQVGIGETIKEGAQIVSIMPALYDLAVEMYVRPIDLPLMEIGQEVRIQFDGWPAIVFSGWPNTSYGTYGGEVFAIDNFISPNGMYRVLVAPDPNDVSWPNALRVGSGAISMVLLKEVPVWYELWRQINGFPPDYYKPSQDNSMAAGDSKK